MDLSDGIAGLALLVSLITLVVSLSTIVLRGRRAEIILTWEVRYGPPQSEIIKRPDVSEHFVLQNVGQAPARDLRLTFRAPDGGDASRAALGERYSPTFSALAPGHRVAVSASHKTFADVKGSKLDVAVVTWRDKRRGLQTLTTSVSAIRVL